MTAWTTHLMKVYHEMKKKNCNVKLKVKLKDAMKVAKYSYRK
jgi:hypothetical protein